MRDYAFALLAVEAARQGDIQRAELLVPTEHFRDYGLEKLAAATGNVGYALAAGAHRNAALAGCAAAMVTQGRINDAIRHFIWSMAHKPIRAWQSYDPLIIWTTKKNKSFSQKYVARVVSQILIISQLRGLRAGVLHN